MSQDKPDTRSSSDEELQSASAWPHAFHSSLCSSVCQLLYASSPSMANLNCNQPELRRRLTGCNTCSGLRTELELGFWALDSLCLQVIGLPVLVVLIKALSLCRRFAMALLATMLVVMVPSCADWQCTEAVSQ